MPNENQTNLAWKHGYTIAELPEPPETFNKADAGLSMSDVRLFAEHDLIEKVPNSGPSPVEWRVDTDVYETAVSHVENTDAFSCCGQGRGVSNVGGELRCQNCGATVTSEEFRRVLK